MSNSDRHQVIEISCELCGTSHKVRVERTQKGQGRFCSRKCANEFQRIQAKDLYGYEKGKSYWDKGSNKWSVHWYDENGKVHITPYPRWWWTINKGFIPDGYMISYIDGNSSNIDPSNFECISQAQARGKGGHTQIGKVVSKSSRIKMSKAKAGKPLSAIHRQHIGEANKKNWETGTYDNIIFNNDNSGDRNPAWRGGAGNRYPKEFNQSLRNFVKSRDNHVCQICGKDVYHSKLGHVHHIDGNRDHNIPDNLILICRSCHMDIHHSPDTNNLEIKAFQSKLEWNQ
jgi:HNH endonuclease